MSSVVHNNQSDGSIQDGKFLDQPGDCNLLSSDCFVGLGSEYSPVGFITVPYNF
jgi:hypothetical protein